MSLADYQQKIVKTICDSLDKTDLDLGITLCGETGSGKSTIARAVAENLKEKWIVFYLKGVDPNLSPYLTWHIGTKLFSKHKLKLDYALSFGVDFTPVPVHFEIGGSVRREKQDFILTSNEAAIVTCIRKQAGANPNILFIADDYELWDTPSKLLLQKIMLPDLQLLSGYRLAALLVGDKEAAFENSVEWKHITIDSISDDNVLFVLKQRGHPETININDIRACAGNDLSLALMAANYYSKSEEVSANFDTIMSMRCSMLSSEGIEACKILEPLSIIDSCFTKDETAFFIDPSPKDKDEVEYKAEEYLTIAEENALISGNESYHFTNERIRSYFKKQISKKEKYHHRKFAQYLRSRHPEDYFNRGNHLGLSILATDLNVIIEAWQLLLLSYIRRASEIGNTKDVYNILSSVDKLINQLPPDLAGTQSLVKQEFLSGYDAFSKYDYKQTLTHLQGITPSRLSTAFLAECQRIILLCHVQLAQNNAAIDRAAEELYLTISADDFREDEQYCKAALVLIDIYLDRKNNSERAGTLRQKLIKIIQQHPNNPTFEEIEACCNRKSSLYYSAIIAIRQTEQSVCYYQNHFNKNGEYMSLCNHAGNAIILGEYDIAEKAINECDKMLKNHGLWYYPSKYKIYNNRIILSYLKAEKGATGLQQIALAAKRASDSLFQVMSTQNDEVSNVVLFNYLGLSALSGSSAWLSELEEATHYLIEMDKYSQYFLHDLIFFSLLSQNKLDAARDELSLLKSLDVPLLNLYKSILYERIRAQEQLLTSPGKMNSSAVDYHRIIAKACSHIQDPSCRFWGRGFLLSDHQFLSF